MEAKDINTTAGLYTPQHIANFFLSKTNIDNLKLNKLVYISYGWGLAYDMNLFNEPIQAWRFGPVIPSIYHEFKEYGAKRIDRLSTIFDISLGETIKPQVTNEKVIDLLKVVYKEYGVLDSLYLVDLTHMEGSPWFETYKDNDYCLEIPKKTIESYYKKLKNEQ